MTTSADEPAAPGTAVFEKGLSNLKLKLYDQAAAGHAGTMSDESGKLFIKPSSEAEINTYNRLANGDFPLLRAVVPTYMGVVSTDGVTKSLEEAAEKAQALAGKPDNAIKTKRAVVLESQTYGFVAPNTVDLKLGQKLYAPGTSAEKAERMDQILESTTHKNFGFRIAGMRIFRGPQALGNDGEAVMEGEHAVFGKHFGRFNVDDGNLYDVLKTFFYNKAAGFDQDLSAAVVKAYLHDMEQIKAAIAAYEFRLYSASVLFVYEGDAETLRTSILERNKIAEQIELIEELDAEKTAEKPDQTYIAGLKQELDALKPLARDEDDEPIIPAVASLRLIDLAHLHETPGEGPDKSVLLGLQSIIDILERLHGELSA